ncbi:MAG: NAD(P)/FAD-dependent oxidoreductase [Verrucomicrobiota bacterium JB022]|nr:NAD(P)/FAD-dependent oxidoreductase [Verrucomicrobiota bacterium JB022]
MNASTDVAIIGGGPAGSVAAAALAQRGHRVTLLEASAFPRFKIGESLLPNGNAVWRAIGVWDKIERAGFVKKEGAEFLSANGSCAVHNVFARGLMPGRDYTYQVERSRFDHLLLEHAREQGVEIRQPAKVAALAQSADGWTLNTDTGETLRAAFVLDASGRTAVLGHHLKLARDTLPYPKRLALYLHARHVRRDEGARGGNIIITRLPDGWSWFIPVDGDRVSLGVVTTPERLKASGQDRLDFFWQALRQSPQLAERLAQAEATSELHVTADYSYSHTDFGGPRHLLVGDAACFIDPIFSSGVYLASESAYAAAQLVDRALQAKRPLRAAETTRYTHQIKARVQVMRQLIENFYDDDGAAVFMHPSNVLKLFDAVNSVVAGCTRLPWRLRWRYAIFNGICAANRRWHFIPRVDEASQPELGGRVA